MNGIEDNIIIDDIYVCNCHSICGSDNQTIMKQPFSIIVDANDFA